jgi:hypothetical protein
MGLFHLGALLRRKWKRQIMPPVPLVAAMFSNISGYVTQSENACHRRSIKTSPLS